MTVRIVGNLDCETAYSRSASGRSAARLALSQGVRRRLAALSTILRVLAPDATPTRLRTLEPVDPARLPTIAGIPDVTLEYESSERAARDDDAPRLPWGETDADPRIPRPQAESTRSSLVDALWTLPPASVGAAAIANSRATLLDVADALDERLPGARLVRSLDELDACLAASATSRWVVKAIWSAAGRDRVRGSGADFDRPDDRTYAARLLERDGALLFEPWMNRIADVACSALVDDSGVRILGAHTLVVDAYGRFEGIAIDDDSPPLEAPSHDRLVRATRQAAEHLAAIGYRGPIGVDAWTYRDPDGNARFHALGEINARLTFGIVARAAIERLDLAAGRLVLGRGDAPANAIPLLAAGPADDTAAWIEIAPAPTPTRPESPLSTR